MTSLLLAHADGAVFGAFCWWTFLLRFGQFLANASSTLLVGFLLAGWLSTRHGRAWLSASLAGPPMRSMLRAAILGLIAPLGALGALPVATAILRAGIQPSAVVSFLVTAPLFLPWSAGLLADQVGLLGAGAVLSAGVLLAVIVGFSMRSAQPVEPVRPCLDRSESFTWLRGAARLACGSALIHVSAALLASAGFAAILQPGALEAHLEEASLVTLLGLSVPLALASIEPDLAATFAGEFWRIGLLPGGVPVCLLLGAGWNLGVLTWCLQRLGRFRWTANVVWIGGALLAAVLFNVLLRSERPGEADSHAFDVLTKPYNFGGLSAADGAGAQLRAAASGSAASLAALGILLGMGAAERIRKPKIVVNAAELAAERRVTATPSPRVVRMATGGALLLNLGACLYAYFPPPTELDERLRLHRGDLFGATATLCNSRSTDTQRSDARNQVLNAIDRIEATLTRYRFSRVFHRAGPSGDADMAQSSRARLHRMRTLVELGDYETLRGEALSILGCLPR